MRLLFAFVTAAMLSIVACTFQVRADAAAALQEAMSADNRHDYATELRLLRPLAEQGNALAQLFLGAMYHHGLGIHKDQAEAFRLPHQARSGEETTRPRSRGWQAMARLTAAPAGRAGSLPGR